MPNEDSPHPELGEIVKLLKENEIAEFELQDPNRRFKKIKLKFGYKAPQQEIPEKTRPEKPRNQIYMLKSKLVGSFHILKEYNVEGKESEPFVKLHQKVGLEDTLCVIEAMKLNNEIKLKDYEDFKGDYGIIEKIEAEEGGPVEYGQLLLHIKPGFESENKE